MTLLLDAGAFVAVESGDRRLLARLSVESRSQRPMLTHGGIVGQVWRNGTRQARLAKLLSSVRVAALDEALGRRAGVLLAAAGTSDVVDAALVLLARGGDQIVTSDPHDLVRLASAARMDLEILVV